MKKIIATIAAGLLLIAPALADDDTDKETAPPPTNSEIVANPPAAFAYMVECSATQLSLMHLRLQIAASITALSAANTQPQLAALVTSYKNLADSDRKQIAIYVDAVLKVVIPAIIASSSGLKQDDLLQKAQQMTDQSLTQIAEVVSNPHATFETQTQLQTLLLQQSEKCDALVQTIIQRSTL